MLGNIYSTAQSFHTRERGVKIKLAKICHEIDDILNQLGGENYCPYEDLEAIQEKLLEMTD
jgi:hypothetical protein